MLLETTLGSFVDAQNLLIEDLIELNGEWFAETEFQDGIDADVDKKPVIKMLVIE